MKVKDIVKEYFPEITDKSEIEHIIWGCTGFPHFWHIPQDGNTPEECFRTQLKETREYYDEHGELPDPLFNPDWTVCPGATIMDAIEERGWTVDELAAKLPWPTIKEVIQANEQITEPLAEKLATVIGGSKEFWIRREQNYRTDLSHGKNDSSRPVLA